MNANSAESVLAKQDIWRFILEPTLERKPINANNVENILKRKQAWWNIARHPVLMGADLAVGFVKRNLEASPCF